MTPQPSVAPPSSAKTGPVTRSRPPCPFQELATGTPLSYAQKAEFVSKTIHHEKIPFFIQVLHEHEISGGQDTIAHQFYVRKDSHVL